jgi:hypothetical protein
MVWTIHALGESKKPFPADQVKTMAETLVSEITYQGYPMPANSNQRIAIAAQICGNNGCRDGWHVSMGRNGHGIH